MSQPDPQLWSFQGRVDTSFTWGYELAAHGELLDLYEKGKRRQWDAAGRLNWDEELVPIWDSPLWSRLTAAERTQVQVHTQAHSISQFLHGEQGALLAAARVVGSLANLDAKLFAATQVMDEARHVEAYARLLREKFPCSYPIDPSLRRLLADGLSASEWDMTLLTMQILVENVALASFQRIRDHSGTNLATAVNAYVMQDEARHVAFGRQVLADYYGQLSMAERSRREDFVLASFHQIRVGFLQREVWENLGLPAKQCVRIVEESAAARQFMDLLLGRLVPVFREIGLWSASLSQKFEPFGAHRFAKLESSRSMAADEAFADALASAAVVAG